MSKRERSPTNNDKQLLERIEKKKADDKAKLEAKFDTLKIPLPKLADEEATLFFKELEEILVERYSLVNAGTDFWICPYEFTTSDMWKKYSVHKWLKDYENTSASLKSVAEKEFARKWTKDQIELYLTDIATRWNQLYSVFIMSYDPPRGYADYHHMNLRKKATH